MAALRPYSGHAFAGMTVRRSLIYFADFSSRTVETIIEGLNGEEA